MDKTVVVQRALPQATLQAVQADADALAECPNFWVPRDVVEGRAPALAAAEQAVQQLYRRLVKARLAPFDRQWTGAEYWCQIYEQGRGLGFHFDKDEHAMREEDRMVTPLLSSVLYLTGSAGGGPRQAPTVLIDQWFNHEAGCVEPEHPAWSALVFPVCNQYCLFSGEQAHGVLEAMEPAQQQAPLPLHHQGQQGQQSNGQQAQHEKEQQQAQQQQQQQLDPGSQDRRRATFLVNWWAQRPESVERATAQDVAGGRLAPARSGLGCGPQAGPGGEAPEAELAGLSLGDAATGAGAQAAKHAADVAAAAGEQLEAGVEEVGFVRVEAGPLPSGSMLPVDELLEERGVQLTGAGAVHAVVLAHAGLTLVPLDEENVDPQHPLQVLAALLPTEDLECGSSDSEDSEADT